MIIQEALYNQVLIKHERYMKFVALMNAEISDERKWQWLPHVNAAQTAWQSSLNRFHAQVRQWSTQPRVASDDDIAFRGSEVRLKP